MQSSARGTRDLAAGLVEATNTWPHPRLDRQEQGHAKAGLKMDRCGEQVDMGQEYDSLRNDNSAD